MAKDRKIVVRKSKTPAWARISNNYTEAVGTYNQAKYDCIQEMCILEKKLRDNEALFSSFCKNRYWKGQKKKPSIDQPEDLLKHLLVYMCRDTRGAADKASLYKRAALNIMSGKVPREEIAAELEKRGGIKAVASPQAAAANGKDLKVDDEQPVLAARAASSTKAKATKKPDTLSRNSSNILFVDVGDDCLSGLLALLEDGNITLEISLGHEEPDGFKRVVLEDFYPS